MAGLRSLSINSNIPFNLGLASSDCIFFIQFESFPVHDMTRDVGLEHGHVCMRPWMSLKPSILIGFLWQGRGLMPHYNQVEVEVQIPHSASVDTLGGGLVIAGKGWSPGSPLELLPFHFQWWVEGCLITARWGWKSGVPCGLHRCQRDSGWPRYCLVEVGVSVLSLSFFDTILTGLLGYLVTTSQKWKSRLSAWPSLARMGMGPQIFLCAVWLK